MSAQIVIHTRSVERFGLYGIAVGLKNLGYDVFFDGRKYVVQPQAQPMKARLWPPSFHTFRGS